jgi:AmmeMemoRadiSam system protein A/AmmeMemoRadiSam system protein B
VAGRQFRTVIILGPSHHALFEGAALPAADAMKTPLGLVRLSPKVDELATKAPFAVNPSCQVQRPEWWSESPQGKLPPDADTPFSWEHSVEDQLPFLQRVLGDFRVVPVVLGQVDPEAVGEALLPLVDDETLLVASSDLTHFLTDEQARAIDAVTTRIICSLSAKELEAEDREAQASTESSVACGKLPILALMHVARAKGWKARLLDYSNSSEFGTGTSSVVGYSAIAFYEPAAADGGKTEATAEQRPAEFSADQRKMLLELARKSAAAAAAGEALPSLPAGLATGKLAEVRAVFVTLTKNGDLRGCIGTILPREPLHQAVIHAARSAAVEDSRFPTVQPAELKNIRIEISVLTVPRRLECKSAGEVLAKLRPGIDGVVLKVDGGEATYLPQVWEQLPDKEDFLDHLARKAGLSPAAWRSDQAVFEVYQVEAFKESPP